MHGGVVRPSAVGSYGSFEKRSAMQRVKTDTKRILETICKFAGALIGALVVAGKKVARSLVPAGRPPSSKPEKEPAPAQAVAEVKEVKKGPAREKGAKSRKAGVKARTAKPKRTGPRGKRAASRKAKPTGGKASNVQGRRKATRSEKGVSKPASQNANVRAADALEAQ